MKTRIAIHLMQSFLPGAAVVTLLFLAGQHFVSGASQPTQGKTPHRLALLVSISNYGRKPPVEHDWQNLQGAPLEDVRQMSRVLSERFHFKTKSFGTPNRPDDDIWILTDAQATKSGILKAFQEHLINKAQPGDLVIFF